MADATNRVSLESGGFEAGARKVQSSARDAEATTREAFAHMGNSADAAFGRVAAGADKAARSYKALRSEVDSLARANKAADGGGGGGGHGGGAMNARMRSQMLMHSSRAGMDSIMAGQSPMNALLMEGPRLAEVAGLSMGATIGVSALALAVGKLVTSYHEAGEAKKEFDAAATFVGGRGTSAETYRGQIDAVVKARDELREKTGGFTTQLAETGVNFLTRKMTDPLALAKDVLTGRGVGNPNQTERDQDEAAKERQISGYQSAIVAKLGDENDLRAHAVRYGQESIAVAEIRLRKEEAITEARQRAQKSPGLSADGEVREIERSAKMQEDAANLSQRAASENIRLESSLLAIRREGGNVELRTADARLASARALLALAPVSGEAHDTAANRVGADEEGLRKAVEGTVSRQNQAWLTERAARYGHGATRQYQELTDRRFMLGNEIDANTAGTREDGGRAFKNEELGAKQMSEQVQLNRAMDDFKHGQEMQLADAKASLGVTQMHASGMDALATKTATVYQWQKKIAEATRDQQFALAATYQAELDVIKGAQKLDAFLHPEKGQAQRAASEKHATDQRTYDLNGGLLNVRRDNAGNIISGTDPETFRQRDATKEERQRAYRARVEYGAVSPLNAVGRTADEKQAYYDEQLERAHRNVDNAINPRKGVAEENRQTVKPTDAGQAALVASVQSLVTQQTGIAQAINKLAAKIAIA